MRASERQRLYVKLGASKTRKRLKHFGHGVHKVEAVDRNRSVIIHTATGEHLRELENFLVDVIEFPLHSPIRQRPIQSGARSKGPGSTP